MGCRYKFEDNFAYYRCSKKCYQILAISYDGDTPECEWCKMYDRSNCTKGELEQFNKWDKGNSKNILGE